MIENYLVYKINWFIFAARKGMELKGRAKQLHQFFKN